MLTKHRFNWKENITRQCNIWIQYDDILNGKQGGGAEMQAKPRVDGYQFMQCALQYKITDHLTYEVLAEQIFVSVLLTISLLFLFKRQGSSVTYSAKQILNSLKFQGIYDKLIKNFSECIYIQLLQESASKIQTCLQDRQKPVFYVCLRLFSSSLKVFIENI